MERKEFIKLFGAGATFLFAGCLGGCAVSQPPATTTTAPQPADAPVLDLHLDLSDSRYAALQDPRRGFVYLADGHVIVAKTMEDIYVAVSADCPHLGEQLRYQRRENHFECPSHGSQFKNDGALAEGPSRRGLRPYRVTRAGTVLHIEG